MMPKGHLMIFKIFYELKDLCSLEIKSCYGNIKNNTLPKPKILFKEETLELFSLKSELVTGACCYYLNF